MSDKIEIFQEHGGVLQSSFGRATVTYFGHQIEPKGGEVTISPAKVTISVSEYEKEIFEQFRKPLTPGLLLGKAKSAIYELKDLDCNPMEKKELLKTLKSELNEIIKSIE